MGELTKKEDVILDETYDENYTEEAMEEKMTMKTERKKLGLLQRMFSKTPPDFNPPLLSDEEYIRNGRKCFDESVSWLDSTGWMEHKKGSHDGDIVKIKITKEFGKIFLLTGTLKASPEFLNQEMHHNLDKVITWNPTIMDVKRIKKINDACDIIYQVNAGGGGGAVKPRDFVILRYCDKDGDRIISCGVSIEYPGYPPTQYIRGDSRVACWSMSPIQGEDGTVWSKFQWLMVCDLKGWIPQYVIDVAMPTAMFDLMHHVREFLKNNKSNQVQS